MVGRSSVGVLLSSGWDFCLCSVCNIHTFLAKVKVSRNTYHSIMNPDVSIIMVFFSASALSERM